MVDALETERENISKLEKADVLELTVRHLQRLQASRPSGLSAVSGNEISAENRWQSGFGHCAAEACRFLSSLSGEAAERLARHLASGLQTSRRSNSPSLKIQLLSPSPTNRTASNASSCVVSSETDSVGDRANVSPITATSRGDNKDIEEVADTSVSTTVVSTLPQCEASMSPVNDKKKVTANCNIKLRNLKDQRSTATATTTRNKSCTSQDINAEDDEEIDVERVEERNTVWRPW
ncbi:PREDICTED: enhancer of split mgamma protein-like isoform X2 [Dinoponera quadriceps]|nr:PREDICTED: enhancer of split mgamma protein-like isoform X2 [Dinoponera quadriceps]XP_014479862.1 PREDICTED: enhancer of split mgamma protein-like isoform X2 [Dinoponera quadriceps]XP_014479863.1 PREDICTED: enhancer of split mgamma protein-like isoform X2 [Dinoponera quadriceps]